MTIGVDRTTETRVGSGAFRKWPPVVAAGDTVVDLLEGCFADIVDEHAAGSVLEREGERIAKAQCPNRLVGPNRAVVDERVVRRDRPVCVQAQDLSVDACE